MWAWLLTLMNRHGSERGWGGNLSLENSLHNLKKPQYTKTGEKTLKYKKNNDRFNKHIYTCITLEHVTRAF